MSERSPHTLILQIDARSTTEPFGQRDFERIGEQIAGLHESGVNIAMVGTDHEPWAAALAPISLEPIRLSKGVRGKPNAWTDEIAAIYREFETGGIVFAHRENSHTGRLNTLAGHLASRIAQSAGHTSLLLLCNAHTTPFSQMDMRYPGFFESSKLRRSILSAADLAISGGADAYCAYRREQDVIAKILADETGVKFGYR